MIRRLTLMSGYIAHGLCYWPRAGVCERANRRLRHAGHRHWALLADL